MKKIFATLVILFSILSGVNAKEMENNESKISASKQIGNAKIIGGFGLKLGDTFDIKSATGSSQTTAGEILYTFSPSKKIKYFKHYYVLVTPKSHKIREIWGVGSYENTASCKKNLDVLEVMLEKKYGGFDKPTFSMEALKYVNDSSNKDRGIAIKCTGFMNPISFYIMYKDSSLNELSKKEEAEMEAAEMDSSAL